MARATISIIEFFNPESALATEFRRILHTIRQPSRKADLKAILVTSSTLSEGKSTTCSLLGVTSARENLQTLVVDCDLRRPTIHKLFKLERERGVTELLSEGLTMKNVIKRTGLEKLDIITAGRATPHPAEVFDSPSIGRLVEEVKFYYDVILIDSAPVIPVSDPMLLAQEVDGVIIVVRAGKTQREVVSRSVEIVNADHPKVIGVILNNADNTLPYYYDYAYYGYRYQEKPSRNKRRSRTDRASDKRRVGNGRGGNLTKSDESSKGNLAR
jgi:capsular exopolysaccharide synthesis family protein